MRTAGNVGKSLVNRYSFYERREITDNAHRGVAEPLVFSEVPVDEMELRAKFACPPSGHSAADSKCFRFVRSGEHHSSSDRDGLSAQ